MTDIQFILYISVTALAMLGTFACAFVALFGDWLRAKWFPPKFQAEILWPHDPLMPLGRNVDGQPNSFAWFYHLTVENKQKAAADNVSLHIIRVEEPGPNSAQQIRWRGDVPVRCRNQEQYPVERKLGSPIDYDLCMVARNGPTLSLMPLIAANNLPINRTQACDFIVTFEVRSAQGKSDPIRVRIAWNGQWNEGQAEMERNLPKPEIVKF